MFRGVRIVLRGLSDTLEHLLQFFLYSAGWWLCVLTVVLAPPATLALFRLTDPRAAATADRPEGREVPRLVRENFRRSWKLALLTMPALALVAYNLAFYGDLDGWLAIVTPAWLVVLIVGVLIAVSAFAILAHFEESPLRALKLAAILTGGRLWHAVIVGALLWVELSIGRILIVPLVMFLPATIAATINRLVMDGLGVPVHDPLTPTDERRVEEAAKKGRRWWGP